MRQSCTSADMKSVSFTADWGALFSAKQKVNHMKFTEQCVMCKEKYILEKTMFTNEWKNCLQLGAWEVHNMETLWYPGKEKSSNLNSQ